MDTGKRIKRINIPIPEVKIEMPVEWPKIKIPITVPKELPVR